MNAQPSSRREPSGRRAVQRQSSWLQTVKAVSWTFFGVRRRGDHEHDVAQIKPLQLLVTGAVLSMLFIMALLMLIRWVLASGIAA